MTKTHPKFIDQAAPPAFSFQAAETRHSCKVHKRIAVKLQQPPLDTLIIEYDRNGSLCLDLWIDGPLGTPTLEEIKKKLIDPGDPPEPDKVIPYTFNHKPLNPWRISIAGEHLYFHLDLEHYGKKNMIWRTQNFLDVLSDYVTAPKLEQYCQTMLDDLFLSIETDFPDYDDKIIFSHQDDGYRESRGKPRYKSETEAKELYSALVFGTHKDLHDMLRHHADPNTWHPEHTIMPLILLVFCSTIHNLDEMRHILRKAQLLLEYGANPFLLYSGKTATQTIVQRAALECNQSDLNKFFFNSAYQLLMSSERASVASIYVSPSMRATVLGRLVLKGDEIIRQRQTSTTGMLRIYARPEKIGRIVLQNGDSLTLESKPTQHLSSDELAELEQLVIHNFNLPDKDTATKEKELKTMLHTYLDHYGRDTITINLIRDHSGAIIAFSVYELLEAKDMPIHDKPTLIVYTSYGLINREHASQYRGIIKILSHMRGFTEQFKHPEYTVVFYYEASSVYGYGTILGIKDYFPKNDKLEPYMPMIKEIVDPLNILKQESGIYYIEDPLEAKFIRKRKWPEWPTSSDVMRQTYWDRYHNPGHDLLVAYLCSKENFDSWSHAIANIVSLFNLYNLVRNCCSHRSDPSNLKQKRPRVQWGLSTTTTEPSESSSLGTSTTAGEQLPMSPPLG